MHFGTDDKWVNQMESRVVAFAKPISQERCRVKTIRFASDGHEKLQESCEVHNVKRQLSDPSVQLMIASPSSDGFRFWTLDKQSVFLFFFI